MYSRGTSLSNVSTNGTGFAGSLVYSSKPLSLGASNESLPFGPKYNLRGSAFFGGHESYRRQTFVPVSKIVIFAVFASPPSFKYSRKKGSRIAALKESEFLAAKFTGPKWAPPPGS